MWLQSGNFARRYVFPDGELLPVWETLKHASEALFEVRDVENLREHYARTLAHWFQNLEARPAEARVTARSALSPRSATPSSSAISTFGTPTGPFRMTFM